MADGAALGAPGRAGAAAAPAACLEFDLDSVDLEWLLQDAFQCGPGEEAELMATLFPVPPAPAPYAPPGRPREQPWEAATAGASAPAGAGPAGASPPPRWLKALLLHNQGFNPSPSNSLGPSYTAGCLPGAAPAPQPLGAPPAPQPLGPTAEAAPVCQAELARQAAAAAAAQHVVMQERAQLLNFRDTQQEQQQGRQQHRGQQQRQHEEFVPPKRGRGRPPKASGVYSAAYLARESALERERLGAAPQSGRGALVPLSTRPSDRHARLPCT
jgi:hypothetical protein